MKNQQFTYIYILQTMHWLQIPELNLNEMDLRVPPQWIAHLSSNTGFSMATAPTTPLCLACKSPEPHVSEYNDPMDIRFPATRRCQVECSHAHPSERQVQLRKHNIYICMYFYIYIHFFIYIYLWFLLTFLFFDIWIFKSRIFIKYIEIFSNILSKFQKYI